MRVSHVFVFSCLCGHNINPTHMEPQPVYQAAKRFSDVYRDIKERYDGDERAFITHSLQSGVADAAVESLVSEPCAEYCATLFGQEVDFDVPFPPTQSPAFTFIDLFAGIGGFRIPLQWEGGKCVFSSEFNPYAQQVYEANYGEFPYGDITKIPVDVIPRHDVLTAGFPCQPFSISGKMRGFEDTRGTLIYSVFKIAEAKKPKVVFLENVKHLVHHDNGHTLRTILEGLEHLGYHHSWQVLNASDFGVAQNRERILIVASQDKEFDFSKIKRRREVILRDVLDDPAKTEFEYLEEPYTILPEMKKQPSGLIFAGYRNKKIRKAGVRPGTEHLPRVHKQPNRIYSIDGIHPALPSQETSGRFWIWDGETVRKLTINECYKIMGFPPQFIRSHSLAEQYREIGNSVCIPMIQETVKEIKRQLL